jgi:hypothetical protein
MTIHWKRRIGVVWGSLLAAVALSGCGGALCPGLTPLESAARYPEPPVPGRANYGLARNAWIDNQRMTAFLQKAVASEGVDGLVSKLQFQCTLRPADENCVDCYICKRTVAVRFNDLWVLRSICVDADDVLVQAYVGPGHVVRAMTYWTGSEVRTR